MRGEILMTNNTWNCNILQSGDLPIKAQRFLEMVRIDTDHLTLMTLTPCPDGTFIKSFDDGESENPNRPCLAVAELNAIYFFSECVKAGVAIHELAHVYFRQSRYYDGIEYDFRAMGEKYIKQNGINALSNYARISIYENAWEEVVCEIIAAYGRRGQFGKIRELLNQYCPDNPSVS
jgi:hypothetical protein